jgi:alanyl aminopeptidase
MAWGDSLNRDTDCFVLEQPAQRFELPADSCPAWLLPNAEGEGYYRWSLPPEGMRALTDVFDDALTARDRISVADSLNASTRAGRMEIEDFLERVPDVLGAVDRQSAILPVDVVEKIVLGLSGDDLARFQAWLRPVLKRRLAAIDAPGGAESDAEAKLFRISLMRLLVMYGNDQDTTQSLASSAGDFLRSAAAGEASVYPDRDLQYLAMMAYGLVAGKDEASLMAEVVTGSEDAGLRADILRGLAVTRDPDAARVAREFVISGKVLDTQLPTYLFWTLFPLGQPDGWAWVKDSFDQFIDNVPVSSRGVLPNVFFANWLCSDTEARELRALFEPRRASIQGATRALEQADEMISICSAFRKRQLPGVSRFLDQAGI